MSVQFSSVTSLYSYAFLRRSRMQNKKKQPETPSTVYRGAKRDATNLQKSCIFRESLRLLQWNKINCFTFVLACLFFSYFILSMAQYANAFIANLTRAYRSKRSKIRLRYISLKMHCSATEWRLDELLIAVLRHETRSSTLMINL